MQTSSATHVIVFSACCFATSLLLFSSTQRHDSQYAQPAPTMQRKLHLSKMASSTGSGFHDASTSRPDATVLAGALRLGERQQLSAGYRHQPVFQAHVSSQINSGQLDQDSPATTPKPYNHLLPVGLLMALGGLVTAVFQLFKNGSLSIKQGSSSDLEPLHLSGDLEASHKVLNGGAFNNSWAMAMTLGDVKETISEEKASKCPFPHDMLSGKETTVQKEHTGPYTHMPGPRPLPNDIVDNMLDVSWIVRFGFTEAIVRWEKKYGSIFRFAAVPGIPGWTFTIDPECVQYISNTNAKNYMGRFLPAIYEYVYQGKGILGSEGDYNRRHRQLCQAPFLSTKLLKIFSQVIVERSRQLNAIWAKSGKVEMDIAVAMQRLTLDVIGKIAFSYDFKELERTEMELRGASQLHEDRLLDTINRSGEIMGQIFITPLPILKFMRGIGEPGIMDLDSQLKEMRELVTPVIQERRKALQNGEPAPDDLLGVLLTAENLDGSPLTDDELWDDVHDVMGAGHETTGSTLTAALYTLAEHPEVYQKLKEELTNVLGGRDITFDDIEEKRLPYLEMVVKEVLRLYPAIPLFPRIAAEDDVLPTGHFVPAGEVVFQSGYAMGRSPRLFDNPMEFRPERFTAEEEAKRHPKVWAPFGAGPRMCLGSKFAMLSVQMMLATVMQENEFINKRSRGKIFPIEYDITMNFPGGVPMQVIPAKAVPGVPSV